jgi:DNA-binding XRE family transcriptional regulator
MRGVTDLQMCKIFTYDRLYLPQARETLGAMLDYVVWDCKLGADEYFALFVTSGLADRFGRGDPKLLSGMSGVEIAWETFARTRYTEDRPRPRYNLNRSKEYWVGWALAHCQWATSVSFRELTRYVPPTRMAGLYSPYHERDVQALVERVVDICRTGKKETNLKLARQRRGMSQSELAEAAQVPLRTLQQYEQGQKNILKANVSYAVSLAHVLGCSVEEILDYI